MKMVFIYKDGGNRTPPALSSFDRWMEERLIVKIGIIGQEILCEFKHGYYCVTCLYKVLECDMSLVCVLNYRLVVVVDML